MTPTRRSSAVVATLTLVGLTLTGCGGGDENPPEPQTRVVVVDTSSSVVEGTDLLPAAQNRVAELLDEMDLGGGTVAVKALNNVSASCADLTFTLDAENETVLDRDRTAIKQDLPSNFDRYVECAREADPGGTQLFGLLAETAVSYPDAQTWDVYTDGLDNYDVKGMGKPGNLRDPDFPPTVIEGLHPSLVPELSANTTIVWHALGRGSDLGAAELAGLRQVYELWTSSTGATAKVATN